jgi:hypothetical protein
MQRCLGFGLKSIESIKIKLSVELASNAMHSMQQICKLVVHRIVVIKYSSNRVNGQQLRAVDELNQCSHISLGVSDNFIKQTKNKINKLLIH